MYIQVADYSADSSNNTSVAMAVLVDSRSLKIAMFEGSRSSPDGVKEVSEVNALDVFSDRAVGLYRTKDDELLALQGITSFSFDDVMGLDEVVDYSIIDLYARNGVPQPWTSRLASTRAEKILYSARYRSVEQFAQLGSVYIPFATGDLNDCVVHLVRRGELVCNLPITYEFDGNAFPVGPGGALWTKHFWHAEVSLESVSPSVITYKVKLRWNIDDTACHKQTKLFVETDAGYLPRNIITTDENGEATFKLMPIGLNPMEPIKVKVSAQHYSKLGSCEVTVP